MNWFELFLILIWCHWLGDFGLQSEVMAERKNWKKENKEGWNNNPLNPPFQSTWRYYLSAHGFIHGAVIYLFTGIVWIALVESFVHIIFDYLKTSEYTNIHWDQFLHLISKIIYILLFLIIGGV